MNSNSLNSNFSFRKFKHDLKNPISAMIGYSEYIIEEIEFDNTLPIELQKKLSNILKSKLNSKNPSIDFIDLISLAKDKKLLSNDAIHLLHIIRRQRNLFAHNSIEPKTRLMRVIYVIAAFSLLSSEF